MSSDKAEPEALEQMQQIGGEWAAYRNEDLGSLNVGHLKFLKIGEGCTYKEAPIRYPDESVSQGHNYRYAGVVNLETGEVVAGGAGTV